MSLLSIRGVSAGACSAASAASAGCAASSSAISYEIIIANGHNLFALKIEQKAKNRTNSLVPIHYRFNWWGP